MIERLPYYYRKSQVVRDLYTVIQKALDMVSKNIEEEALRLFITTTTDFTLHEKDVALPEIPADIETKRSRVIARIQGNSVLTKAELEHLVKVYDKTGCTITEDFDNYTVTILFSGITGIPYNIDEIKATIEEVRPAHILIEYAFITNTWDDVKQKVGTWNNAAAFTWDSIQNYDGRTWFYVHDGNVYLQKNNANAYLIFNDGVPYARYL